jgi:hypothetical protein
MTEADSRKADLERFRTELLSCADVPAARAFRPQGDGYYLDCWSQVNRISAGSAFAGDPRMRETIAERIRACEESRSPDAKAASECACPCIRIDSKDEWNFVHGRSVVFDPTFRESSTASADESRSAGTP